jgi:hypothetical protein
MQLELAALHAARSSGERAPEWCGGPISWREASDADAAASAGAR